MSLSMLVNFIKSYLPLSSEEVKFNAVIVETGSEEGKRDDDDL